MTIVESLKALREGKKVRNKIWEEHEYIMLKNGFIKYGNGVTHRIDIYGEYDMCDDTWEEYKEPILTDKERKYLSAVIRPFRNRVKHIYKINVIDDCSQLISIRMERYDYEENLRCEYMDLPYFKKDTMYKNMETGKKYTLEELGLYK